MHGQAGGNGVEFRGRWEGRQTPTGARIGKGSILLLLLLLLPILMLSMSSSLSTLLLLSCGCLSGTCHARVANMKAQIHFRTRPTLQPPSSCSYSYYGCVLRTEYSYESSPYGLRRVRLISNVVRILRAERDDTARHGSSADPGRQPKVEDERTRSYEIAGAEMATREEEQARQKDLPRLVKKPRPVLVPSASHEEGGCFVWSDSEKEEG